MIRTSKHMRLICLIAFILSVPGVSWAQTTAQLPLQFDFLTPGARSMALGSAFIGLSDDATAVVSNPAGLLTLARPEVSFEGRYRGLDTPFLLSGRLSGTVTNTGEDTISGPQYSEDRDTSVSASFASFVYPKPRWAVAFFTHQPTAIKNEILYRGVFEQVTVAGTVLNSRDNPLQGTREISIRQFGGTAAFRLSSALTAGVGVSAYTFKIDTAFRRLGLTSIPFGAPDPSQIGSTNTQVGDDTGLGLNAGLQVEVSPRVKLGGVFRLGPSFEYTQTDDRIPGRATLVRNGTFKVPDSLGVGMSWRPSDALLVSADYVLTRHSQIKDDYINFQAISTATQNQLIVDDSNEFHAGVEYVLTSISRTPALRGGFWWDPDHSVRYESAGSTIDAQTDFRLQNILPGGDSTIHLTGGIGLPVSQKFELNGAFDYSKNGILASFSTIIRF